MNEPICKFCFFVPVTHAERVKEAVFAAGAGRLGNYDHCAWETPGRGQFRPLPGSSPFLGKAGEVEYVEELKVEMLCPADKTTDVIAALRQAHPYETPAFELWPVQTA